MKDSPRADRPVVIVGAGGHGREVLWVLQAAGRTCAGFVDDGTPDLDLIGRLGAKFLGSIDVAPTVDADFLIGIGAARIRRSISERLQSEGMTATSVVHPRALIGPNVQWGLGFICFPNATITTNVLLGEHVHVNVNATISHDCKVGSYVTISPGANISGNASLGEEVTIGAGATVIQGKSIGVGATVGAGAVVTSDIAVGVTAIGVPARPMQR